MKKMKSIMRIHVHPIDRQTMILKNGGMWSFSYEPKSLTKLSQSGEWIYGAKLLKERDYYVNPCLSQLKNEF